MEKSCRIDAQNNKISELLQQSQMSVALFECIFIYFYLYFVIYVYTFYLYGVPFYPSV